MKAAWDQLGGEYEGSSVVVGDADCTVEKDLCERFEVRGYPTIKYFTGETGAKGEAYNGGRDLDSLKKFVVDTLEVGCDIDEPSGCDEKELSFIEKVKSQASDFIKAQLERLNKMKQGKMGSAARAWLNKRVNVLTQMFKKQDNADL